jgi:hypothetical protein
MQVGSSRSKRRRKPAALKQLLVNGQLGEPKLLHDLRLSGAETPKVLTGSRGRTARIDPWASCHHEMPLELLGDQNLTKLWANVRKDLSSFRRVRSRTCKPQSRPQTPIALRALQIL